MLTDFNMMLMQVALATCGITLIISLLYLALTTAFKK